MSAQFSTPTDELLLLAETLGEVKSRTEKLETEFSTQAKPLEAATNALSAALSGIKALQFHVLDNNLGALSARVEEMRKAVDEQVGVIALELKKADETNAAKAGAEADALRAEIVALQSQLGSLVTQFGQQLERVEFAAKEEAKKLQLIPGPAGAAGASLNPRGTFIDGETYNRLDVVSWLGSSYIATVDGVTEKPSKNSNQWQTLASRGSGGGGGVGDFGSLAGVAQINQGGTGQTTALAGARALLDGISTTRGTVLYRGSDGWTALAPGSADTVLKSQGAGADPAWGATTNSTAASNAQAAAGTSTTTFITPANAGYAAAPVVNGRAPRQGLVFDGTAGATVTGVPAFGTSDFTVVGFGFKASLTRNEQIVGGANGSFGLIARTDGTLITDKEGTSANTASTGTFSAGKFTQFVYVRSGNTGTYYINGVSAGTTSDSQNYSASVTDIGNSTANANSQWNGFISVFIYNRALSAAEVVALYESGVPASSDYNTASVAELTAPTAFINFQYDTFTGATASGFTAAETGGQACQANTGNGFGLLSAVGTRYRVTFNATLTSGATPLARIGRVADGVASAQVTVVNGANDITFTIANALYATSGTGSGQMRFDTSGNTSYSISDLKIYPLGLLLAPDASQVGNGYVWNDVSGNLAQIALPSSGVLWNVPSIAGNRIRGTTNTNGNQQLLGSSQLLPAESQILYVRARSRSGTPSITVGTSSGGSQIVASVALSTTWKNLTIALTGGIVSSADDIWIGSNSTDVVETDISWQPLDF
jgi:hypothetical protein